MVYSTFLEFLELFGLYIKLSRTDNEAKSAEYLDMNVDTKGAFFKSKLFDKRENFSFKVINFPCMKYSNIPATPSYGIFLSQLMRISRISTKLEDFQNLAIIEWRR